MQNFSIHWQTYADCNNRLPFSAQAAPKIELAPSLSESAPAPVSVSRALSLELVELLGLLLFRFALNYKY